jgi:hypothetical protein
MFRSKYKGIIVAHNDAVNWIGYDRGSSLQTLQHLQLDQVLSGEVLAESIPKMMRGDNKTLCIIPDHWFESATYPFQSKKRSLIEPFLRRKLATSYPDKKTIQNFFDYRRIDTQNEKNLLSTHFLQDNNGLKMYSALKKMNLAPRQITAPGFLWESKLARMDIDFDREGTLLIHICDTTCLLYFYFNGTYLFSRNVFLAHSLDDMDSLIFEINQSLYMFSQKTKSDLAHIYLLTEVSQHHEVISQGLSRDLIDITQPIQASPSLELPDFPFLNGLLETNDLVVPTRFFSVTHRHVKQLLEWRPVQWAGAVVGSLLALALVGECLFLNTLIQREKAERVKIHQAMGKTTEMDFSEYDGVLESVLERIEQPTCTDALYRILACLSPAVQIKSVEIGIGNQPELKLDAVVNAAGANEFKQTLAHMVENIRENFNSASTFSVRDINIRMESQVKIQPTYRYRISLRLNLV